MSRHEFMKVLGWIAWGFVVFCLDINIVMVNLLPDWITFYLFVRSLPLLAKAVPSAELLEPLGKLLGLFYCADWLLAIVGLSLTQWYLVNVVVIVLVIYFNFQLLTNLAEAITLAGYEGERKILVLRTALILLTTLAALPIQWAEYPTLETSLGVIYEMTALWVCMVLFGLRKKIEGTPQEEPSESSLNEADPSP